MKDKQKKEAAMRLAEQQLSAALASPGEGDLSKSEYRLSLTFEFDSSLRFKSFPEMITVRSLLIVKHDCIYLFMSFSQSLKKSVAVCFTHDLYKMNGKVHTANLYVLLFSYLYALPMICLK